jgi:quinol monooxygenase YgiN
MTADKIVRLVARMEVNPSDWESFKLLLAATKQIVREAGDQVLVHDCYFDQATHRCLVIESYVDEEAFLSHLQKIQVLSEKFVVERKIMELELLGGFSLPIVEMLREGAGGTRVRFLRLLEV